MFHNSGDIVISMRKCLIFMTISIAGYSAETICKYPYADTQDYTYNFDKAKYVLQEMNKTLDSLSTRRSLTMKTEMEMTFARGNLIYTMQKMDLNIPQHLHSMMRQIVNQMQNNNGFYFFIYPNADAEYCMKIITKHAHMYQDMLEPISVGRITETEPLQMSIESYKAATKIIIPMYSVIDICLKNILQNAENSHASGHKCFLNLDCYDYMTTQTRYGLAAIHGALYLLVAKIFKCGDDNQLEYDMTRICKNIYKELLLNEVMGFPKKFNELFDMQVSFCASAGYGEVIKPRWINRMMYMWQNVTSYETSIVTLAVYLRTLLEADIQ